jgi:hypothetical protein
MTSDETTSVEYDRLDHESGMKQEAGQVRNILRSDLVTY